MKYEDLDLQGEYPLRTINSLESLSGGQGVVKCDCLGACGGRCKCKKASVPCNSKCHKGKANLNCKNKL